MSIVDMAVGFLWLLLVSAAFLWLGTRVAAIYAGKPQGARYCSYFALFNVSLGTTVVSLLPLFGWALAWVVLFGLLRWVTRASVVELLIMVAISQVAAMIMQFAVL